MGLFSGFSSALSSIGSSISGAFTSGITSLFDPVAKAAQVAAGQVSSGLQKALDVAAPALAVAQFIPGIGAAIPAITGVIGLLGSQGQPVQLAGAAAAAARPTIGPALALAAAAPVANLPPRTTFGFGGFGQPSFGAPFNAANFSSGMAGSTARGFGGFAPTLALGSAPFGFGFPGALPGVFSFTGFRPSLAGFSFLGRF